MLKKSNIFLSIILSTYYIKSKLTNQHVNHKDKYLICESVHKNDQNHLISFENKIPTRLPYQIEVNFNKNNKISSQKAKQVIENLNVHSLNTNNDLDLIINDSIDEDSNEVHVNLTPSSSLSMLKVSLNPYLIIKNKDYLYDSIENYSKIEVVSDYSKLRMLFKSLDDRIDNKIILISKDYKGNLEKLEFFRDIHTKIVVVNSNLYEKLKINNERIYEYLSPRLPYKLKSSVLKNFLESQKEISLQTLSEYINTNPISFLLNFGLFRNEYIEIPDNRHVSSILNKKNTEEGSKYIINKSDDLRENIIRNEFYIKRNILQLAKFSPKKLGSEWKKSNTIDLLLYISKYQQLQDKSLEFILYDCNHLFDNIIISDNKELLNYYSLYNNTGLPNHELPQIFIKMRKSIFSFSYFSFSDEFNSYLNKSKEEFIYTTPYDNLTYVETLNGDSFRRRIFDSSFRECILEIKHEGCPSCYMLGKMNDHLSQKFNKHGVLKKIPIFRIDTENDILLGQFLATPTYLFIRKTKDNKRIEMISPLEKNEFISLIKRNSRYDLSMIKYHPNLMYGYINYQKKEFSKKNYDPDLDLEGFNRV